MTLVRVVLTGLLAFLALAALLGPPGFPGAPEGGVVSGEGVPSPETVRTLRAAVWNDLDSAPPGGFASRSPLLIPASAGPGSSDDARIPAMEARLRAAGAHRALRIELDPADAAPPRLDPPRRLRVGRPSGGMIRSRGDGSLVVRSETGVADTIRSRPAADGSETGPAGVTPVEELPFVVVPTRSGWTRWEFELHGREAPLEWWGWVEEERPLRVLAVSGPPGPDMRAILRALEERGELVDAWIHLGRDLWVGRDGGLPSGEDALEAWGSYDAVLLFPGHGLSEAARDGLMRAAEARGIGLLFAGGSGAAVGESVHAEVLDWSGIPLEIPPLPPTDLEVRIEGSSDRPLLFREVGRVRVVEAAILDSWRWRMEAGLEDAHRAHWAAVLDWLTAGLGPEPVLEVLGAGIERGGLVPVRWTASDPELESPVIAMVGTGDSIEVPIVDPAETGFGRSTIVAAPWPEADGIRIEPQLPSESRHPGAWVRVGAGTEAGFGGLDPGGWRARVALASPGGEVLSPDRYRTRVDALPSIDARRWLPVLLFLLLAGLTAGDWTGRRLRGRA